MQDKVRIGYVKKISQAHRLMLVNDVKMEMGITLSYGYEIIEDAVRDVVSFYIHLTDQAVASKQFQERLKIWINGYCFAHRLKFEPCS